MSVYADLDPIISKWANALSSELFTEWAGEPARAIYTHGDPPFEAFQIRSSNRLRRPRRSPRTPLRS